MEIKEIQELIRFVAKSGVSEVEIDKEGFKIHIKTGAQAPTAMVMAPPMVQPQVQSTPVVIDAAPTSAAPSAAPVAPAGTPVKAPMVGTFYRSAGPDKEPFVKVGDRVQKGQTICIIEAMKLFNEIEAEFSGTIVDILIENAKPVEFDQPLFVVAED
ncbi:MAG: acetyl-CoA carboxylase biotin carboxyl carrier protein [Bacteroidetes bacterium]|jgi:acetyl-CoA carboxylase biotin carboxyl carrier protein|nr:acetyl-CoA carboxylase biotin carboxyl carrier protein [Bacteroidota bacterium]